jgi:hypothetical protein
MRLRLKSVQLATKRKKNSGKNEIAPALFLEWLDWYLCNQVIEQVSNKGTHNSAGSKHGKGSEEETRASIGKVRAEKYKGDRQYESGITQRQL